MSGSFFYRSASVQPGGRKVSACRTQPRALGPTSDHFFCLVRTLTAAGRPRRADFAFPDSARRERAQGIGPLPSHKKRISF